jgi:hypothetical protein
MTSINNITIRNDRRSPLSDGLLILRPGSLKGAPELLGAGRGAN